MAQCDAAGQEASAAAGDVDELEAEIGKVDKAMLKVQRQLMKKGLSEEEKGELLAREEELRRQGDGMRVVFKEEQARSRASSPVSRERPGGAAAPDAAPDAATDSTTALRLTTKLASSVPVLNGLGALREVRCRALGKVRC